MTGLLILRDALVPEMTESAVRLYALATEHGANGDAEIAERYAGAARYIEATLKALSTDELVTLESLAVMRLVWEFGKGYGSLPRFRVRRGRSGDLASREAFKVLDSDGALRTVGARVWLFL